MRVRAVLVAVVVAVAAVPAACGGSSGSDGPSTTGAADGIAVNGAGPVTLAAGQRATLVLASNPSTGYSWEPTSPPDQAVVRIVSDTYVAPAAQVPGAGGTQEIRIVGVAAGTARLTFGYRRPWETGVAPTKTATFDVTVS